MNTINFSTSSWIYVSICVYFINLTSSTPILEKLTRGRTKRESSISKDCEDYGFNKWSSWGPCYKVHGQNIQSRSRSRRQPFSFGGSKCPKDWVGQLCGSIEISKPNDQRCDLTEWSNWSDCYFYNKRLERERHRYPFYSRMGKLKCSEIEEGDVFQFEDCRNDCGWTTWTQCYKYPTEKGPRWERYRENKSILHRYTLCPGKWVEFQDCKYCEWTSWKPWSSCYEYSAHQERKRERVKTLSSSRRGEICSEIKDNEAEEYGPCSLKEYFNILPTNDKVDSSPTPPPRTTTQIYTPAATYSLGGGSSWR